MSIYFAGVGSVVDQPPRKIKGQYAASRDSRLRAGKRVETTKDITVDFGDRQASIGIGTAGTVVRPVEGGVLVQFLGEAQPLGVPLDCLFAY